MMNGTVALALASILAWSAHIVFYVRYAVANHSHLRSWRFILGHCIEASIVFGSFYGIGMLLADNVYFRDLIIAGGVILLLDIASYILVRDFFRPLMSPLNALLPPLCVALTTIALFLLLAP